MQQHIECIAKNKNEAFSFYCPVTMNYSFKLRYINSMICILSSVVI